MKIGIDIGGSHVGIGLINLNGRIIAKEEQDMSNEIADKNYSKKLVETIIQLIEKILEDTKTNIKDISLIGIAVPGTVSDTHIIKAKNLHINNFNIVSEINNYFNIPIVLRNDAKCAAIAEKEYGSLKKYDDSVFLTLGTGIGGAVYLGGKLLKPKKYEGFEIGHMVIEKDGLQCNCGRKGCFEKYASMKAFKENIQQAIGRENLSSRELKELLESKTQEEIINKVIKEYIEYLSIGIANLVNIFEPQVISIGGSFVYFQEFLLERLNENLKNKNMFFNDKAIPKIVVAKLRNDAGIIGSSI